MWATIGNAAVAMIAGFVAEQLTIAYGFISPFMVSAAVLVLCLGGLLLLWSENYGDSDQRLPYSFSNAITDIRRGFFFSQTFTFVF